MHSEFGLFSQGNASILQELETEVEIFYSIAKVCFTQVYYNPGDTVLETEYLFPINELGVFDKFTAEFEDKYINGVIKEK